jgi:hypothetical protein
VSDQNKGQGGGGEDRVQRRAELAATLLLALATVGTAWASYQAARWNGKQSEAFGRANASRHEATVASGVANRQVQVDVATFIEWVDAYARGETELQRFYRKRFRPEFTPAVDAWIATRPLKNPSAPLTPFAMPQYRLAASREADRLEADATAAAQQGKTNIQRSNNYVLGVVLFASALFFAGISIRLSTRSAQLAVLGLGWLVFLGTVVWIATFPVTVTV